MATASPYATPVETWPPRAPEQGAVHGVNGMNGMNGMNGEQDER